MSDTEYAWLECGPRVGLHVFKTDPHTIPGLLGWLRWRYGLLAPLIMTAWACGVRV